MSHDRDLADQDVEELSEEIWTLGEQSSDHVTELRRTSRVEAFDETLRLLSLRGLVRLDGDHVLLTAEGRELAKLQVRRHRLAEMLFTTALEVEDDHAVNRTACVMEHVLGAPLTDSICAFLGHPKVCPHGKPIPPGPCCRALTHTIEPLVQPLDQMAVGQATRVVHIAARRPERLVRLSNLGVIPGATVCLQQKTPAAVIQVGDTTLALEPEIAGEIYVKPIAG